jgi:hypothetical protein
MMMGIKNYLINCVCRVLVIISYSNDTTKNYKILTLF